MDTVTQETPGGRFRTFYFRGSGHDHETTKAWADQYDLTLTQRFDGEKIVVAWPDPPDCTVAELLGRARLLNVALQRIEVLAAGYPQEDGRDG